MTIARHIRFAAVAATSGLAATTAYASAPATYGTAFGSLEVVEIVEVVEERPVMEDFGQLALERVASRLVETKLERRAAALRESVRATFEQAAGEIEVVAWPRDAGDGGTAEEQVADAHSAYDELPAPIIGIESQRGPALTF